ncbi:MAG: DUF3137 domain-containing protein [Opitutales bacterium]
MQNKNSNLELFTALDEIKRTYKRSFPFIFVFMGILLASVAYMFYDKKESGELVLLSLAGIAISIIGICVILTIRANAIKKMKMFFAKRLMADYFSEIFENFDYNPTNRIDNHILRSQMFLNGRIDEISGSDYISANYKGLELEMSDVSLTEVKVTIDSKGRRRESRHKFFKGLWCVCDLKRTLQTDLWIIEKRGFLNSHHGTVDTDNEAFNKHFAVYTKTPVEAFYVLTPHMMEYIEAIDKKVDGKIHLRFLPDGKLYIAINSNRDSFEFGFNCTIPEAMEIIKKDLGYITDFIDELMDSSYYRR